MLIHPQFDPVALQIGPLAIRWYGLMYLIAFLMFYLLGRYRVQHGYAGRATGMVAKDVEDLLFYGIIGLILGARFGYAAFYQTGYYLRNPIEVLAIWQGGMSFHGGLIGVILACWLFAQRRGIAFFDLMDFVAPLVPIGLAAGRIGNFINGELWGRVSNLPWAMAYPQSGSMVPRHPSQLYQAAGEGLLLFAFLWWYSSRPRRRGQVAGMFLVGYGVLRSLAEFAREPDAFLGVFAFGLTMGQILSMPMIALGLYLLLRRSANGR